MTAEVLKYVKLDANQTPARPLPELEEGARVELRVIHADGREELAELSTAEAGIVLEILGLLEQGRDIAVTDRDRELTPNQAAAIIGISRPLLVRRMDIGDLPYRMVGSHRRLVLRDVLEFKKQYDEQMDALRAFAVESEALSLDYGLD